MDLGRSHHLHFPVTDALSPPIGTPASTPPLSLSATPLVDHGSTSGFVDMESIWSEDTAAVNNFLFPPPHHHPPPSAAAAAAVHCFMTEEQLETLRRQISIYATICQQLVEMHKATLAHQHTYNGLVLGHHSPVQDAPMLLGMQHKPTSRQRWTPSQNQLRILERLFKQGNGTPNRQRIKEITNELSQHGQISETNVYNWFQNRKARAKRKQRHASTSSLHKDAESEVETDGDSPEEKRTKLDHQHIHLHHQENTNLDNNNNNNNGTNDEGASSRFAIVMINGKAWKVKPGRFNVRNFGENALLLDPRGHVVAMNECGVTLEALQPGGTYTVNCARVG